MMKTTTEKRIGSEAENAIGGLKRLRPELAEKKGVVRHAHDPFFLYFSY